MKELFKKFRYRKVILAAADAFIISVSALVSNFLLAAVHFNISNRHLVISIVMSVVCCGFCLLAFGAYNKLWRYFNIRDYLSCIGGVLWGMAISCLFFEVMTRQLKLTYTVIHFAIATLGVCVFRFLFKQTFIDLTNAGHHESQYKRTMIIGGGQACKMLLKEIRNAKNSQNQNSSALFNPVCILDDDRKKIGTEINGVTVVGTTGEVRKFVVEKQIEQIIFAIPSCLEDERQRILDICSKTTAPVKIIPFIGNLIFDDNNPSLLTQVRDIRVEDLLGREPIKFDNADIKDFINGKVCMITGGGGSIGSELVRQIAKYSPKQVIIVDIYENNAYDIQQELIMEYGDELNFVTLIASVRDYYRMNQIFDRFKPDIVFHAAAHKHVPLMENSPMEAIKNNVIGTFNTATLAQFHDVEKFVMISTDKAVNPTNVMGASKRMCEMIIQMMNNHSETDYVAVRFGNVLGSNGSVIPLFKKQIEAGGPVTVTDKNMIRYFMTIPEAVSLILEAGTFAEGGEIFVLDMGKPVKIDDMARQMISLSGFVPDVDIKIEYTGLRPGEKLYEELLMAEEGIKKTQNNSIFIGHPLNFDENEFCENLKMLDLLCQDESSDIRPQIKRTVPTYQGIPDGAEAGVKV